MTRSFDVVIIGAGHNGLVCAAYLAKAGKSVLVVEAADEVGGAARNRELAPGASVSACAHILHALQPKVVSDLALKTYGLKEQASPVKTIALGHGGKHLVLGKHALESGDVSASDKAALPAFIERMERHAGALAPQLLKAPPRLAMAGFQNTKQLAKMGWDIRFGLGEDRMRDFLRIAGMNIHGLLDEIFESEAIKGALAFDSILGTPFEPRMAGTVVTWLFRLAGSLGSDMTIPAGGMGKVSEALASAARTSGAEIRTGSTVERVLLENGEAVGVVLESGEEIRAPKIVSNADPKTTFLKLVGARNLEAGLARRIGNFRTNGRAAKVHLVLKGMPEFAGLTTEQLSNRLIIAPSRRYLELAFNPCKYRDIPDEPAMEITMPTAGQPGDTHVLSIVVQYVPYDVEGGWDAKRDVLLGNVIATLSGYAPGIDAMIKHAELLAPPDLEAEFGMTGGNWHHGDLALDQIFMMRPVHGTAQYKTPIDGLWLCGAGAHPGGGVMGAAGHNAAQVIISGEG